MGNALMIKMKEITGRFIDNDGYLYSSQLTQKGLAKFVEEVSRSLIPVVWPAEKDTFSRRPLGQAVTNL
jgi:hypothetical protein